MIYHHITGHHHTLALLYWHGNMGFIWHVCFINNVLYIIICRCLTFCLNQVYVVTQIRWVPYFLLSFLHVYLSFNAYNLFSHFFLTSLHSIYLLFIPSFASIFLSFPTFLYLSFLPTSCNHFFSSFFSFISFYLPFRSCLPYLSFISALLNFFLFFLPFIRSFLSPVILYFLSLFNSLHSSVSPSLLHSCHASFFLFSFHFLSILPSLILLFNPFYLPCLYPSFPYT